MTNLEILKAHVATHSSCGIAAWLKKNTQILHWLNNATAAHSVKNVMERVYIVIYGAPEKCKYGNARKFNTFDTGYRAGCVLGNRCACIAEIRAAARKLTLLNEHGVENVFQIRAVQAKIRSTNIERYGVEYSAQNPTIHNKSLATWAAKSDAEKESTVEQRKQTMIKNWGVDHHMKLQTQQEKLQQTNLLKHGVEFPLQNAEILAKMKQTSQSVDQTLKREKTINTLIKHHHVTSASRIGMSEHTLAILDNKEKFCEFVSNKTREAAITELDIASHTLYLYSKKYDAADLFAKPATSKFETAVAQWLQDHNIHYVQNTRSIIAPRELDFFLPQHNTAIECCGLYWHAENSAGRDKFYHSSKTAECAAQNIRLITVFQDEWDNQYSAVNKLLESILTDSTERIPARKCVVREISKSESATFLEQHHLQGSITANTHIGLIYAGVLVAVMTFGKPRFSKKFEWELLRYSSVGNIQGGAAKLFQFFKTLRDPQSVVSYSDLRWFTGKVYEKLNFASTEITVGYTYTDYRERFDRMKFQKHLLVEAGHSRDKTEWQIMQELGYDRIWDCGQIRWVWQADAK